MTTIDPIFVQCIKDELREGHDMTISVPSPRHIPKWRKQFTPLELRHITFVAPRGGDSNRKKGNA